MRTANGRARGSFVAPVATPISLGVTEEDSLAQRDIDAPPSSEPPSQAALVEAMQAAADRHNGAIPLRVHNTEKGAALVHFLGEFMAGEGREHWFMAAVKTMGRLTTQHDVVEWLEGKLRVRMQAIADRPASEMTEKDTAALKALGTSPQIRVVAMQTCLRQEKQVAQPWPPRPLAAPRPALNDPPCPRIASSSPALPAPPFPPSPLASAAPPKQHSSVRVPCVHTAGSHRSKRPARVVHRCPSFAAFVRDRSDKPPP